MTSSVPTPEIANCPERSIVALARDFDMSTRGEIPALWKELWGREFNVENAVPGAVHGVSFGFAEGGAFRYGVGYEARPPANLPTGACVIKLRAGSYAVFRKRAPIAELPRLFDDVFQVWLPTSEYQVAEGAVFERYPDDPEATETARTFEIWVPVVAKS